MIRCTAIFNELWMEHGLFPPELRTIVWQENKQVRGANRSAPLTCPPYPTLFLVHCVTPAYLAFYTLVLSLPETTVQTKPAFFVVLALGKVGQALQLSLYLQYFL